MTRTIYLDHNSTTPCAPEVVEAMAPFFSTQCGNPSSIHLLGREAQAAVTNSRELIADMLGCEGQEIVFTSGATESNNQVFSSCALSASKRRKVVILSIEHKSVLGPAERLSNLGFTVQTLGVDRNGTALMNSLEELLDEHTLLVSIQAANNEIGTKQPIREIAERAHACGALIHCDATQALGKECLNVYDLDIDFASFSAHKLYGPKGVGALYIRLGQPRQLISPLLLGGGQEETLRAGTLNVPGIAGFATACSIARLNLPSETERISRLRNQLETHLLSRIPGATANGDLSKRLAGTTNITIPGISADTLIANTPFVCFSGGSACTDGTVSPSHVLLALGLSREEARSTIRIGVGRYNSQNEIDSACTCLVTAVEQLRSAT
jgi:cysteine desulfurase